MKQYLTRKLLIMFRDKLVKHLMDMKERPQSEIIQEVWKLLTNLADTLED